MNSRKSMHVVLMYMKQSSWIPYQCIWPNGKQGPDVSQIVNWYNASALETGKLQPEISYDLKQFLQQRGKLKLQDGVLYHHTDQSWWDQNEFQLALLKKY